MRTLHIFLSAFSPRVFLLSLDDIRCVNENWDLDFLDDYPESVKHLKWINQDEVESILLNPRDLRSEKDQEYSIMDLPNIRFNTSEDLEDFLRDIFWINFKKKDGYEQFNKLYHNCVDLYESRYLRKVPKSLRKKKFSNVDQIHKLLSNSWEGNLWTYTCDIAKVFFSYARIIKKKKYKHIDVIHEQVLKNILWPIQVDTIDQHSIVNWYFRWIDEKITLHSREKSLQSIVWKEIADVKYNSIDNFKDLHGFTFECESKKDLVILLQQYYNAWIFSELPKIVNKNLLSSDDLIEMDIDLSFKKKLLASITETWVKENKRTSDRYQDIKLSWYTNFTDPNDPKLRSNLTWIEIKFTLKNNENEKWINFQLLYDYQKRFRELTRLSGIVRQKDIMNFVNDFYEKKDKELSKKWINPTFYIEELYNGLYRYFECGLQRVKKSKKSKKAYYVNPMYFNLSDAWINEEIIQLESNWTSEN